MRWRIAIATVLTVLGLIALVLTTLFTAGFRIANEDIIFGRPDGWRETPDFEWRNWQHKLLVRSILIADIGDPPDLVLRRAGPDNVDYNAAPAPTHVGASVGALYWQVWGTNNSWGGDNKTVGRIAQIYARLQGTPTGTSRPGSLHLGTTRPGEVSVRDGLIIDQNQRLWLYDANTGEYLRVEVGLNNSCGSGYRCLQIRNWP